MRLRIQNTDPVEARIRIPITNNTAVLVGITFTTLATTILCVGGRIELLNVEEDSFE
jgi:hypothetical protein